MEKIVNNNSEGLNSIEVEIHNALILVTKEYTELPQNQKKIQLITDNIKKKIGDIGRNNNFKVRSSVDNSEWLYDLVWHEDDSTDLFSRLILALESELSGRSIQSLRYDFTKILVANSDYRVFICFNEGNQRFPDNLNRLINIFEDSVQSYKNLQSGSRILILIWDDYHTGNIYPHLIIK